MSLSSRRIVKIAHTLGSFGMAGGLAAFMLFVATGPDIAATEAYAAYRQSLNTISNWLILPSMVVTLFSGLIAMAIHFPYHNAGWVWLKLLLGLLVFESTLASVDGPAQQAAAAAQAAVAGEMSVAELSARISDKWVAWWILLTISALNVVLAILRPRFKRRRTAG